MWLEILVQALEPLKILLTNIKGASQGADGSEQGIHRHGKREYEQEVDKELGCCPLKVRHAAHDRQLLLRQTGSRRRTNIPPTRKELLG